MSEGRPQPIWAALLTKETLTSIVILFFLVSRDLGFNLAEDTKLQIILVVTIVGGAAAGKWARDRSTPVASPQVPAGTEVQVVNPATGDIKTKTV
jgi:hypothetical protein